MDTMIRSVTLTNYVQVAQRHGLQPLALMREVGLDAAALADPEHLVPLAAACRLLELSAERGQAPGFGLEMAEQRKKPDFGPIGLLLAHQRTLRDVLLTVVRYRHLLNSALAMYLEPSGDKVVIREEMVSSSALPARQANELVVGLIARIARALLGQHWQPCSVNFTHAAPADLGYHRQFFRCPIIFNSDFNGIVCLAADLERANPGADPELVRYAESLAAPSAALAPDALVLEVRKAIYLLLPLEQASLEAVAASLHLSVRTLQRRLAGQGRDFSQLLDEVRHELAVRYLANPANPVGRIALLLGYGRQASFTRWFYGRFGITPRQWRGSGNKYFEKNSNS